MKWAVGGMFVSIVGTAGLQAPPLAETLAGLTIPRVPGGSVVLLMGVIGGVIAFGMVGLFAGPVVIAVALALWEDWLAHRPLDGLTLDDDDASETGSKDDGAPDGATA